MNVLQNSEPINPSDLQIWNNAAFDNGDSQDFTSFKASMKPESVYLSSSFDSDDSTKENRSPLVVKSSTQIRPNGSIGQSKMKPIKTLCEQNQELIIRDEKKIDADIEETVKEINRLSSKLQVLKLEKEEYKQRKNIENTQKLKKIGEKKRGFSLGPSEIVAGGTFQKVGKPEMTPVQSIQSRRKSCFWKLQEIGEEKVINKERGKSLSPKSRKGLSVTQGSRNTATTIGSRKGVKKDDGVLESIQPKKLFKDGEKSVATKKPMRPGRIVASRYNNLSTIQSAMKKRSLPENDKDESKRCDKKRASFVAKTQANVPAQCGENRVKKRWEIPNEIVVFRDSKAVKSPPSISVVHGLIPRIRTSRFVNDTPRDSGPAKRVSEMVGKKSFFSIDEDDVKVEASVCQALSFADEDA